MNTEYRKLKNLFLRQSCQDAWEDYARSIRKVNFFQMGLCDPDLIK